jgi:uracil-DNA glycosylase
MEKQKNVEVLLEKLAKRESTDTVFNPYRDKYILNNLREYFTYLIRQGSSVMLVGEAPGYNGCRWTGIPFTSGFMVRKSSHKMFKEIGERIFVKLIAKEASAKVMWEFLGIDKPVPVLWNSFPFHPHDEVDAESNRKPLSSELQEGVEYLKIVYDIFRPKTICSLGRVGEKTLKKTFPGVDIIYIRHPSRGGKEKFQKGMKSLKGF